MTNDGFRAAAEKQKGLLSASCITGCLSSFKCCANTIMLSCARREFHTDNFSREKMVPIST